MTVARMLASTPYCCDHLRIHGFQYWTSGVKTCDMGGGGSGVATVFEPDSGMRSMPPLSSAMISPTVTPMIMPTEPMMMISWRGSRRCHRLYNERVNVDTPRQTRFQYTSGVGFDTQNTPP